MKKQLLILTLILSSLDSVYAQFEFGKKEYTKNWEEKSGASMIKEYLSGNETTENWQTMLTLQAHPAAKKIEEVSRPYFEARNSIIALPPKVTQKRPGDSSDVAVELFLGAPGKTPHFEFALARFIEDASGVYLVVYSQKMPWISKNKKQDINVDEIMRNKSEWLNEIFAIPVEQVKKEF